jgi:phosphotransferase system HPr-like phosphotransfer protein
VKCGQTVIVTAEGVDEDAACEGMKAFFEGNL